RESKLYARHIKTGANRGRVYTGGNGDFFTQEVTEVTERSGNELLVFPMVQSQEDPRCPSKSRSIYPSDSVTSVTSCKISVSSCVKNSCKTQTSITGPPPPESEPGGRGPRRISTRALPVPVSELSRMEMTLMMSAPQNADQKVST